MRLLLLSNKAVCQGSRIPLRGERIVAVEGMEDGDRVAIHTGLDLLLFSADGEQELPEGVVLVQAERRASVGSEVTVWAK